MGLKKYLKAGIWNYLNLEMKEAFQYFISIFKFLQTFVMIVYLFFT